jgi:hypothetical protein
LADPPCRVGGELVAAAIVELLHRADQTERALLDEIEEAEPPSEIALGDGHHEAKVGFDHLLLGHQISALDPSCQRHLALGGEELNAPDGAQVEAQRIERWLDGQVELRLATRCGSARHPSARGDGLPVSGDHGAAVGSQDFYALLVEEAVQLDHLLLGGLHFLQAPRNLVEREEAALLAQRDQGLEFFEFRDGRLVWERALSRRGHQSFLHRENSKAPSPSQREV